jgi:hypothetical protein
MTILLVIVAFVIINLLITVLLRYQNANDGWLEYYRRNGGKVVDKGR